MKEFLQAGDGRPHSRGLSSFTGHSDLEIAFRHDQGDFEDAMQIASALACNAELIITRDPTGFSKSPISLANPEPPAKE